MTFLLEQMLHAETQSGRIVARSGFNFLPFSSLFYFLMRSFSCNFLPPFSFYHLSLNVPKSTSSNMRSHVCWLVNQLVGGPVMQMLQDSPVTRVGRFSFVHVPRVSNKKKITLLFSDKIDIKNKYNFFYQIILKNFLKKF